MKDIVNPSAEFEVGVTIKGLKVVSLFKIKGFVGRSQAAP